MGTPDLSRLLSAVRTIVAEDLMPLESSFLREGFAAVLPQLQAVRRKVRDQGLWVPPLPAAYGGLGLTLGDFAQVSEELGRTPFGHFAFNCQAPDIGNMEVLLAHGSPEQQDRYLRPLAAGDIRSCFAMTEPEHAGSNPVWLSATAVKDGGDYVIDGHKWFTTAAEGAAFAIVMAVTDPEHPKLHRRASQIIVPTDTPGFRIVRNISMMGESGSDWLTHAEVRFEGCRVPQSNRIGAEGRRLCAGTGTAGARPHPPLYALDRHQRALPGPDVPLCRAAAAGAGAAAGHAAGRAALDRREPRRDQRCAAAGAGCRCQD